ncbi:MAG: type II secretion system protein GspJ [Oligoflexia bacterium]
MSFRSLSRDAGFTILEVLIAMFLLVVISFAIYQATTETFKLREVLTTEGDFYNGVRLSLSVFQRDFENAYSPNALRPEPSPSTESRPGTGSTAADLFDPQAGAVTEASELVPSEYYANRRDRFGIRPSRMNGKESTLSWISNSNLRIYRDSPESEYLKVRYALENETDPDYEPGLKMLVRTVSPAAFEYDEDRDKSSKRYTLLHGIKSWKFRYYSKERKQWLTSWDSDTSDHQDRFPDLIEIQLEVKAPKGLSYDGVYQFRPELPLNGLLPTL